MGHNPVWKHQTRSEQFSYFPSQSVGTNNKQQKRDCIPYGAHQYKDRKWFGSLSFPKKVLLLHKCIKYNFK